MSMIDALKEKPEALVKVNISHKYATDFMFLNNFVEKAMVNKIAEHFLKEKFIIFDKSIDGCEEDGIMIYAPTQQLACRWLREVHGLHISTFIVQDESTDADGNSVDIWTYWSYDILTTSDGHIIYDDSECFSCTEYQTHEEAVEAAIKYTLENLI